MIFNYIEYQPWKFCIMETKEVFFPDDIFKYRIIDYVQQLSESSRRKRRLKQIAEYCKMELFDRIRYEISELKEHLYYAEINYEDSCYERDYEPLGDYGNYLAMPIDAAERDLEYAKSSYESFMDNIQYLKDDLWHNPDLKLTSLMLWWQTKFELYTGNFLSWVGYYLPIADFKMICFALDSIVIGISELI